MRKTVYSACILLGLSSGSHAAKTDSVLDDALEKICASKLMNAFDEMGCEVYTVGCLPDAAHASFDRWISNECVEGEGSFLLKYSFMGKKKKAPETVYLEQTWSDYQSDLSFHPVALSIWIKGSPKNKGTLRFMIIQDAEELNPQSPHNKNKWQYFEYTDKNALLKDGWTQLVMPYDAFTFAKGCNLNENRLVLNRFIGYRVEITNDDNSQCNGEFKMDALEQLTSYIPSYGTPKFSSIFIQLHEGCANEDWDQQFKASKEVGINTWIIQYAQPFGDNLENKDSFYAPTSLPWVGKRYDIINRMFEAAARNGILLTLGLYPGDYSNKDTTTPGQYDFLAKRNKMLFDELYKLFGQHPNLTGWYITEEFHDGSFPVGWQQEPALSMLANYLQEVAAYIKSKSSKTVAISPALWRGMPADLCGQWFGKIFAQTPDIDQLYLQDIGGRCQVDYDVDLPNWYAEIKKACDAHGVAFGVDVESFKSCWCPNIPMRSKTWDDLREQLMVAGLFTDRITNFSWATFHPGTDVYEGYKKYLKEKKL